MVKYKHSHTGVHPGYIPSLKIQPTPRYAPKQEISLVTIVDTQVSVPDFLFVPSCWLIVAFNVSPHLTGRDSVVLVSELRSHDTGRLSVFVEEFLRFVDLRSQVGAAAAIRVVEEHELAVLLADLVLVEGAFSVQNVRSEPYC